jgi:putative transposase
LVFCVRSTSCKRAHELREWSNALRYVVKGGIPWRWLPNDFPP